MNFYIAFFLPSVLGLAFYSYLKKEGEIVDLSVNYFVLTLLSNLTTMILLLLRNSLVEGVNLVDNINSSFAFSVKYMILTMIISVFLAIIIFVFNKYFSFSIEVLNGRKKK